MKRIAGGLSLLMVVIGAGCAERTTTPTTLLTEGEHAFEQQRYASASAKLTAYLEAAPESPVASRALYVRAMAAALLGKRSAAYEDLERALYANPDINISWRIHAVTGVMRFEDREWESAARSIYRAIERMPNKPPMDALLYRLGLCYERTGRWRAAQEPYRQIVARFPNGHYAEHARRRIALRADHFAVQAGAFRDAAHAQRLAAEFRQDGLDAYIRQQPHDGDTLNIVLVGRYDRYEPAFEALRRVRGYVPSAQIWP